MGIRGVFIGGVVLGALVCLPDVAELPGTSTVFADAGRAELRRTAHPPIPTDPEQLWLIPKSTRQTAAQKNFARGIELIEKGSYAEARPLVSQATLAKTPLAPYARYYTALVDLRTGAADRAREGFRKVRETKPTGVLMEWALLGEAQAAEQSGDHAGAAALFRQLVDRQPERPEVALAGLARTLQATGDRDGARNAWLEIYYDHPLSGEAAEAKRQLDLLGAGTTDTARDLARAERLFTARRHAEALSAFRALTGRVGGDHRELVDLRVAECHFYLGQYRQAVERTQPYLSRASRRDEARFFHLSALRGLGQHAAYVDAARKLAREAGNSPWVEETLNNLATHYILTDDDAEAARVFAQYLDRFPNGKYGARASWKLGWWRYRQRDFEAAASIFDRAAAAFPRSDYRPAWLYWSAQAYDNVGQSELAAARYALVTADYLHSYYGRLAEEHLERKQIGKTARLQLVSGDAPAVLPVADASASRTTAAPASVDLPPNASQIRHLVAAGLHSTADAEVRYAQRTAGTRSPVLEATRAWLLREMGEYRAAINAMKRAYPQYLSDQGHLLPAEALRVIFPLDYWPLIQKYARQHGLDPYLIAALVAQESSFDAGVVSPANAYGLMQILPSTGRKLARSVGIRRFSTRVLTNPETNVRLGTLYFKQLVDRFGAYHYALASYNAGASRVVRWREERGEMPQDEFIDDIPFPETQNYVKKILGTAEDYRRLYGGKAGAEAAGD